MRTIALYAACLLMTIPGSFAQSISYTDLYDPSTFTRTIDISKPVEAINGAASVTPTGATAYTIPIFCAPGTNGMTPQLSIVYNSQSSDGILGQGWNISGLSSISRAAKDIYRDDAVGPVTYTNEDHFLLNGQRLVPVIGSNGAAGTTYATEAETYSKSTSLGSMGGGPQYFTVQEKDGRLMEFGNSSSSRFLTDDGSKVMIWRLNKIIDQNGNCNPPQTWTGFKLTNRS